MVQGRRGQDDGAGVAANQSLSGAARGGPGPIVPAVLPKTVGGAGAAGARGEWGGARGARHGRPGNRGVVVVFFHVVETLDGDCRGSWRRRRDVGGERGGQREDEWEQKSCRLL